MGHDSKQYPLERILGAADLASSMQPGVTVRLQTAMNDPDSGVRYWGVMGVLMRGADEAKSTRAALLRCLADSSPHVRIAAAETLGRYGTVEDVRNVVPLLIQLADAAVNNSYVAIHSLNAIDAIGSRAAPWKEEIVAVAAIDPKSPERVSTEYTRKLLDRLSETL